MLSTERSHLVLELFSPTENDIFTNLNFGNYKMYCFNPGQHSSDFRNVEEQLDGGEIFMGYFISSCLLTGLCFVVFNFSVIQTK